MMNAWLPLDKKINDSIWKNKVWDAENKWWIMDDENMVIYLITRCVFEKDFFSEGYIHEIKREKSRFIQNPLKKNFIRFFNFTPKLLELVEADEYEVIVSKFKSFMDY